MVWVQVVCRHTSERAIREALDRFKLGDIVRNRTNHILVEVGVAAPTADILMACREHAYAYLRVVAWEQGGGLERTGDATCVSGLEGQPLKPLSLTIDNERANLKHALFAMRNGLTVARAQRQDNRYQLHVTRHRVKDFRVEAPEVIANEEFEAAPMQWLSGFQEKHIELDQFVPLMRAVLRKVECVFCGHCHYREISEDQEKEES